MAILDNQRVLGLRHQVQQITTSDQGRALDEMYPTGWGPRSIALSCLKKVVEFSGLW